MCSFSKTLIFVSLFVRLERVLRLVSVIGQHHISVGDMKLFLNCLKHQLDGGRADRLSQLVQAFERMTLREGPLSMFHFGGGKDCVRRVVLCKLVHFVFVLFFVFFCADSVFTVL